jgi:membrane protein DedA with SNARE-associated domain/membrane-associated phospholipid phosphatase
VKPIWLVLGAALAAFLVWRRRKTEPTLLAGGALAVAAMLVYGAGLVKFPNVEHTLVTLGEKLGAWTYLLVGAAAFFETGAFVGLIAPGETVMLVGGLIAGQGRVELLPLIAVAWACAVAGDVTSFLLGRRLGRAFLVRHGAKVSITEERLHTVEAFFDRHGGKAILLGRFVGLVRAIAPFLAGSGGLPLRRFLPYDIIGAGLWSSTFILLGYVFWASFDRLLSYAKTGALALGTTIVVIVGAVWLWRWLSVPANRRHARAVLHREAQRPALRPVVRVLTPVFHHLRRPAMFVWNRLTPGELGLEFTTLVAITAVGTFAFVSNLAAVRHQGYALFDIRVLNMAGDVANDTALDVAAVVTNLGALPTAIVLVAVTSVLLVWRGEGRAAASLVAGLVLTYVVVHITKDAVARPRPASAVTHAAGFAYPSAHAAYSVTWVACASALTRALPTIASRFAFVTVSLVICLVVGLTRLYLRVHYLSDVIGGWGVGAALFGLCAIVALVVGFLRENHTSEAAPLRPPASDRA